MNLQLTKRENNATEWRGASGRDLPQCGDLRVQQLFEWLGAVQLGFELRRVELGWFELGILQR
jgi:hypothetical protein